MKYTYLILFILFSVSFVSAQSVIPPHIEGLIDSSYHQTGHPTPYFLLRNNASLKELSSKDGMKVLKNLGSGYYIVRVETGHKQADVVEQSGFLLPVLNDWKESIGIKGFDADRKAVFTIKADCDISKGIFPGISVIRSEASGSLLIVEATLTAIRTHLAISECVTYIGRESYAPATEALVNDMDLTHNRISTVHARYPALDGRDIIVSIKENQFDVNDIDLLGKNVPSGISSEKVDNHATEMATIIAGSGNSFVTGRGVAKGVHLSSSDFFDIIPDTNEEYENLSIDAQNHSYGTVIENFYGNLAEAYDKSSFENADILHVFSAGNRGASISANGTYQGVEGYANLTGNFKSSKNTLSIGSVDEEGQLLGFSSRGPAFDGRVKPELVTYSKLGTSNSAAMVTGLGALLNQRYRELYGSSPSAALLKALLITSADDVERKGVDYRSGYGNINGERAVLNLSGGQFETGELADGEEIIFNLEIPDGAKDLKVTLVWTDSAAAAGSFDVLINDLDLKVRKDGTEWLPWVLNPAPANLSDLPTRQADHLNVIEQVTIEELTSGTYSLIVEGFDIVSPKQAFSIAYQYDLTDRFGWSHPARGDNLPYDGENTPFLQWNSTFDDNTTGDLSYTRDGGVTWESIEEGVNLSEGHYQWEDFPTDFSISKMRMTVNGSNYESEEFTISLPQRVKIGFECGDSLLFIWNKLPGTASYNIYNLPGDDLAVLKNTTDTALLISKDDFVNKYVAVEPIYESGVKGLRSYTINYEFQGATCYFTSIFPEAFTDDDKILLTTLIGTTYNIDRVIIERFNKTDFEEIGVINPSGTELLYEDLKPLQGVNIYRAVAVLENGQRIVSSETDIYYLTSQDVMVFPNPVALTESFAVFTRNVNGETVTFELYDPEGKLVLKDEVFSDRDSFSTAGLYRGLYIYRVTGAGINQTGKLVIK